MPRLLLLTLAGLLMAICAEAQSDPWFGRDKALHAAAGTAIGAGGYGTGALLVTRTRARVGIGLGLALGAGAAKEWHDRGGRGMPSWRDFAWDGVGAAAGVTLAWLIDRARHAHTRPATATRSEVPTPALRQRAEVAACRPLCRARAHW